MPFNDEVSVKFPNWGILNYAYNLCIKNLTYLILTQTQQDPIAGFHLT